MGRVSRYKKIKSCDPYSKKNGGRVDLSKVGVWGLGNNGQKLKKRSKRSETLRRGKTKPSEEAGGFDLPPSAKDEFDMEDLVGSVKKQKIETLRDSPPDPSAHKITIQGNVATIPKTAEDEKRMSRFLQVEKQLNEKEIKEKTASQARVEGESKRAYAKRTKVETRQIIHQSTTEKNSEKINKKKAFLNQKKKNKKKGSVSNYDPNEMSDYTKQDIALDTPAEPEHVHFTEQAERPPMFTKLPRGAKEKSKKGKDQSKLSGMTDDQVEEEKKTMDLMRRKVQAQYAMIKDKRKRAGDFHL
jgi:hypothetical protein